MSDDYDTLRIDESDHPIVEVVLTQSEKGNAMGATGMMEVTGAISSLGDRDDVHVIIVRTEENEDSSNNFSAGADIDWVNDLTDPQWWKMAVQRPGISDGYGILDVPQPVISKIEGRALGAGAELATFADIPVAENDALIGDLHSVLGLAGPHTPGLWPALMSTNRAKEMIMRGEIITGEEAEKLGLVNHAVPSEELNDKVDEIAEDLATGSQIAIRTTKRAVNRHIQHAMLRGSTESSALEPWTAMMGDLEAAAETLAETMDHNQIEYPSAQQD